MDIHQLNFKHLFAFWRVAHEQHLTQAARALHISQSTLSTQIQQLEKRLGEKLFLRKGRQLILTTTGRYVLSYADNIFGLGEEMLGWLEGHYQDMTRVRIGAVSTLSRNYQENLYRPLLGDDSVILTIESGLLEGLIERLLQHKLDVVLANAPVPNDPEQPLYSQFLGSQNISVVGRADTWAGQWLEIPAQLDGLPVALPGERHSLRTEFDALCSAANIAPKLRAEIDDMTMLRLIARDSDWLTVLPEVVVQDEIESGVLIRVGEFSHLRENFFAITTRQRHRVEMLDTLLKSASQRSAQALR